METGRGGRAERRVRGSVVRRTAGPDRCVPGLSHPRARWRRDSVGPAPSGLGADAAGFKRDGGSSGMGPVHDRSDG
ncbi:hypothetical protein PSMK_27320 [Phycisphaera mikurensis NBRC 102666]|uniref:Uncharacterized protein n=1 Tax=Phycisphaera mikurensis (strain NBRC 102666 / KCTC 22515 / FYK2301M01) TaxID=1142394 RepID=I0II03_PHYMF|nr:hypothetical protein PSMK_27320 [Phycisphaera mikurensis NBRC 102666]